MRTERGSLVTYSAKFGFDRVIRSLAARQTRARVNTRICIALDKIYHPGYTCTRYLPKLPMHKGRLSIGKNERKRLICLFSSQRWRIKISNFSRPRHKISARDNIKLGIIFVWGRGLLLYRYVNVYYAPLQSPALEKTLSGEAWMPLIYKPHSAYSSPFDWKKCKNIELARAFDKNLLVTSKKRRFTRWRNKLFFLFQTWKRTRWISLRARLNGRDFADVELPRNQKALNFSRCTRGERTGLTSPRLRKFITLLFFLLLLPAFRETEKARSSFSTLQSHSAAGISSRRALLRRLPEACEKKGEEACLARRFNFFARLRTSKPEIRRMDRKNPGPRFPIRSLIREVVGTIGRKRAKGLLRSEGRKLLEM